MPPEVRCDFEIVVRTRDNERVLMRREVLARSGQLAWGSAVEDSVAVTDFEVEISQEATAGNPVVQRVLHGAMVAVRPLVPTGEARGFFDVLLRIVDRGDEGLVDLGETTSGSFDRVHQRVRELGVVLSARVGETVTHRFSGLDGSAIELRMTPRWAVAPATASVGGRDFEYAPRWLDCRREPQAVSWPKLSVVSVQRRCAVNWRIRGSGECLHGCSAQTVPSWPAS